MCTHMYIDMRSCIYKYNDRLDFPLHHAILSESADVTPIENTNILLLCEVTMSDNPHCRRMIIPIVYLWNPWSNYTAHH